MFDSNKWTSQMNHADLLKDSSLYNNVKDLNRTEYKEYMDLTLRHNEETIKNSTRKSRSRKTPVSSNKYA